MHPHKTDIYKNTGYFLAGAKPICSADRLNCYKSRPDSSMTGMHVLSGKSLHRCSYHRERINRNQQAGLQLLLPWKNLICNFADHLCRYLNSENVTLILGNQFCLKLPILALEILWGISVAFIIYNEILFLIPCISKKTFSSASMGF